MPGIRHHQIIEVDTEEQYNTLIDRFKCRKTITVKTAKQREQLMEMVNGKPNKPPNRE